MDPKNSNLRDMTISTSTPKDVKSTSMLSGEAKKTKAEGESNSTTQYTVAGCGSSDLGGMNKGK